MTHPLQQMELDLHHNILPPVGHAPVDAGRLLEDLLPSRFPGWQVLSPVDQVLHSAAHLFFDSELQDRFRDLVDLDGLMRHFGRKPDFWDLLMLRASALGLWEPLALACQFTASWLETPIPTRVMEQVVKAGPSFLGRWVLPLMGAVLMPAEPDDPPSQSRALASSLLLARYHYRRLPLRLLAPHLWHKWRGQRQRSDGDVAKLPIQ